MYFVIATSFFIQELQPGRFSWIHGLSVFTFVTVTLGLIALKRGAAKSHRVNMVGSYFGLWGAFIGAIVVPSRDIPTLATSNPLVFALYLAGIGFVATLIATAISRWAGVRS